MKKTPKHVVWLICDQLRADCLGFMGNDLVKTPNLDRLASKGVIFDKMFVQNPTCMPSRGAMLTGRYPDTIRMSGGSPLLDPRETTLPEVLSGKNFKTGMFGKLHITPQLYTTEKFKCNRSICDAAPFLKDADLPPMPENPLKKNYGFQEVIGFEDGLWGEYMDWLGERDPELLEEIQTEHIYDSCKNRYLPDGSIKIPARLHPSTFIAESASDFFERNYRDNRCFMQVSFVDPHHPFDPPYDVYENYSPDDMPLPKYSETGDLEWPESLLAKDYQKNCENDLKPENLKSIIARYYAMIETIDIAVGKLIEDIEKTGEFDDTLFMFISDHGEHLGDYGLLTKGSFHYEHLIKSPFFVSWEAGFQGGRRSEGLTEEVDLAPTTLDLLDIPIPPGVQGKSFAKFLSEASASWGRDSVFCHSHHTPAGPFVNCLTLRTERYKINYFPDDDLTHLFDLSEDPDERRDLSNSPEQQNLRIEMMGKLVQSMYSQRDPLPTILSQW